MAPTHLQYWTIVYQRIPDAERLLSLAILLFSNLSCPIHLFHRSRVLAQGKFGSSSTCNLCSASAKNDAILLLLSTSKNWTFKAYRGFYGTNQSHKAGELEPTRRMYTRFYWMKFERCSGQTLAFLVQSKVMATYTTGCEPLNRTYYKQFTTCRLNLKNRFQLHVVSPVEQLGLPHHQFGNIGLFSNDEFLLILRCVVR